MAQALLFLLAGFETVSTAFSFLLHELALDFDIQDRLLAEIKENDKKNGGKFDYNSVQSMVYLDMVISGNKYPISNLHFLSHTYSMSKTSH